jgi:predicted nuclease of predicted toxin-antitoxin system
MPRLFFDEPLSEELCETLADIFPGSLHIRLLGQGGAADVIVWDLARQHGCVLVSKDEDFHRLALLRGARRSSFGFGSATVRPTTLRNYCGAITTTSLDSTSRAKRQSSSWAEYNRRPNECSRRAKPRGIMSPRRAAHSWR